MDCGLKDTAPTRTLSRETPGYLLNGHAGAGRGTYGADQNALIYQYIISYLGANCLNERNPNRRRLTLRLMPHFEAYTDGSEETYAGHDLSYRRGWVYRLKFYFELDGDRGNTSHQSGFADLCRQSRQPVFFGWRPALYAGARRHLRRGFCGLAVAGKSASGDRSLCGGKPCGPFHCFSGCFHPDQCSGNVCSAGAGEDLLVGTQRSRSIDLPLSACVDRRGLRFAWG